MHCASEISFGLNVRRPAALATRSTGTVLYDIKSGTWQSQVESVRALSIGSPAQKEAKLALPFTTWAGVFVHRSNAALSKHSGQVGVDLDGLGEQGANIALQTAVVDKFCLAAFRSASGEGVRLLFRIPPCSAEAHTAVFEQVAEHVRRVYRHEPDASGKDVGRASFVSYDNGLWFYDGALVLPVVLPAERRPQPQIKQSIYVGQLADTWAAWYGRNAVVIAKQPDGSARTHKGLLDLGKAIAFHAERIKERLTPHHIDAAFDAWHAEHARQGIKLRCPPEEYRQELSVSIQGAQSKPWFKSAAEKWIRWTRHANFPHFAKPSEKLLFAIHHHCKESSSNDFYLSSRDAALVVGGSLMMGSRILRKLVSNGVLEKGGTRKHIRHAQSYRINKGEPLLHSESLS